MTDLKESIDPDKKNEILTVARLGDKYDFIMSRIESLEKEFEEEKNVTEKIVQRNYELLASQVDRIIDLMKWLGLLLIPLLFSAVRDLFGRKKGGWETSTT